MTKRMELCRGRHEIPEAVDGAIFGNSLDPLDLEGMRKSSPRTNFKSALRILRKSTRVMKIIA